MPAADPAERIANLIDAAVFAKNVAGSEREVARHSDGWQLGRDNAREVVAEIRELRVIDHEHIRVHTVHAESQFVKQRLAESVSILQCTVGNGERAPVGSVGRDITGLEEHLGRVAKIAEIRGIAAAEVVVYTGKILVAVRGA